MFAALVEFDLELRYLPQEEWHMLLSALLATQLRPLGSHGAAAAKKSPQLFGWLQKFDKLAESVSDRVRTFPAAPIWLACTIALFLGWAGFGGTSTRKRMFRALPI